jgi:ATP-dependent DNA ligase
MSPRPRSRPLAGIIEPCLPRPADRPPIGGNWLHEIKHDGFRIMARRDAAGVRLLTRNGYDFAGRFPVAAAAVAALPTRSCLIDGEAIVAYSDEAGRLYRLKPAGDSDDPGHLVRRALVSTLSSGQLAGSSSSL